MWKISLIIRIANYAADETFKATSVPSFAPYFGLLSCELDTFIMCAYNVVKIFKRLI